MKSKFRNFKEQPKKAITLMGMSGVGKTFTSVRLRNWQWDYYSCDYEIGTKYLGLQGVTPDDLSAISKFVGKLGDVAQGGLPYAEFKRRQQLYYDAECRAVEDAAEAAQKARRNFVNDSTGSLCEIEDEAVLEKIGAATLVVYIKADEEHNQKVLERARSYPKPLFFPPSQFDGWLGEYMKERGISSSEEIEPDDFSRWVFPKLFQSRLPKYQRIADEYGVTIPSGVWGGIETEEDMVRVIAGALK